MRGARSLSPLAPRRRDWQRTLPKGKVSQPASQRSTALQCKGEKKVRQLRRRVIFFLVTLTVARLSSLFCSPLSSLARLFPASIFTGARRSSPSWSALCRSRRPSSALWVADGADRRCRRERPATVSFRFNRERSEKRPDRRRRPCDARPSTHISLPPVRPRVSLPSDL